MSAKLVVSVCKIDLGIGVKVAECSRQAVASMIKRRAADRPKGILEPFSQSDKAFSAENDVGMFEAGPGKPKVIKQMIKRFAGDRYTKAAGVGKIRKAQPARLVRLAEDYLLRFATERTLTVNTTAAGGNASLLTLGE